MADKFSSKNIALITIAILLVIMIFSAIQTWPMIKQEKLFIIKEGLLEKIPHQLKSGESYVYSFSSGNETTTIHYTLVQRKGCLEFLVSEIKNNGTTCIKSDGTDSTNSNLTLNNPFVYFFKPWMLAVKTNWSWSVDVYTNITTESKISDFDFYFAGETTYRGRDVFIVKQKEGSSNKETIILIDKEKRILLKEEGKDYTVEITSAPFPLIQ